MLDDPEKSIDLLRAKSISIRGERGEWSGEWVVVEVGQEELTSATLKRKKKKKISKILQGLDGLRNENPNSCDYCT